jgi:Ecdysteroid kinase-like family
MTTETTTRAKFPPLPMTIEEVTTGWLDTAIASWTPGAGIIASQILEVIHGTCTKLRIRLEPDAAGRAAGIPETVILKAGFEPHSRAMHYMHGEEVHAYADVAPVSPLRMPACYFAAYDCGAQQGVVIMEDLRARGVTFLHPLRPQQPEPVARRLSALARHHAMTWAGRDIEPGGRFAFAPDYIDGFETYGETVLTPEVWQSYVESSRGAATSVRFHSLDWIRRVLAKLSRHSKTVPRALLHGDTHLGNLYIDVDGEPGFFDSLPHVGPPMIEIAYHITCALDLADRRTHERDLVALYREALVGEGIEPPPLDELMRQYGCYLATGYLIFLVNAADFQVEAVNTAYTARFSAAMLDHDTIGLIDALP